MSSPVRPRAVQGFFIIIVRGEGMINKLLSHVRTFIALYSEKRLQIASAALSYYLTMTVFPLLICLYTMLGNSHESIMRLTRLASGILAPDIIDLIEDFLAYVSSNDSSAMLLAGLFLLLSYASAAVRSIHQTIYSLQGGSKFEGLGQYIVSLIFSLVFLAAMYFAVLVMLTGKKFIEAVNGCLPFINISMSWTLVRFVVMAIIFYTVIKGIYEAPKRPEDEYSTTVGATVASAAVLAVTVIFSAFISSSANYPLVYGSLASLVLLMLWLYSVCTVIYCGAALNILIRDK